MIARKKNSVIDWAEKIQAYLWNKFLTCIKSMLPYHVYGGCWQLILISTFILDLDKISWLLIYLLFPFWFDYGFTKKVLSSAFSIIILVDETGKVYQVVYIAERTALVEGGEGFQSSTDFLSKMLSFSRWSNPAKACIICKNYIYNYSVKAICIVCRNYSKTVGFLSSLPQ